MAMCSFCIFLMLNSRPLFQILHVVPLFKQTSYQTDITSKQTRLWPIQRVIACANEAEVKNCRNYMDSKTCLGLNNKANWRSLGDFIV